MSDKKSFKLFLNGDSPVICVAGQTIVQAAPHIAPKGCKEGGCGRCKLIVTKGDIKHPSFGHNALSEDHQTRGYILACQTTPLSDLIMEQDR